MTTGSQDSYGPNPAVGALKQAEYDARITYLTTCDQAQRRYQAASQTAWDTYQLTEMQAWDSYVRAVNTARGTYRDLPPAAAAPPPPPPPGDHPYPPAGTGWPYPPALTPQPHGNPYPDAAPQPADIYTVNPDLTSLENRYRQLEHDHGTDCYECGQPWRSPSPNCPHRENNVHPLAPSFTATPNGNT